ncbi:MAG TPA: tetratricopeptide repeat protein [Syntrophales bacterium]|nr:tetratricopeptide repeat protein [Syntrophales bacterium]
MKKAIRILLVAALAVVFVSVNSCSLINYFSGHVKSWESKAPGRETLGSSLNRFAGSVRAARGNPDAHYLLGDFYQGRGRHREAIEEFNKAIRIDPCYVKAYNGIAISMDQMGEHERALEYFHAALEIQPDLDYIHNNLGYSLMQQERYEEAAKHFERANEISGGKISRIRNNLDLANSALGKTDPASVPADPKHQALIEYTTGNLRLKNGNFEEAQGHYRKSLTLNPEMRGARKGEEVAVLLAEVKRSLNNEEASLVVNEKNMPAVLGRDGIEISNGNGVPRMAKDVGGFLKRQGFNVVRLTNAENFSYTKASVYYRGDAEFTALRIKGAIPGITQMKKVSGFDRDNVQVKIIVGKDLASERKIFQQGEK